jgi:hypothetical protein
MKSLARSYVLTAFIDLRLDPDAGRRFGRLVLILSTIRRAFASSIFRPLAGRDFGFFGAAGSDPPPEAFPPLIWRGPDETGRFPSSR